MRLSSAVELSNKTTIITYETFANCDINTLK